ncbi:MAG: hypothetical protein AB8B83_07140 [Bdellovibrionales bacterium]
MCRQDAVKARIQKLEGDLLGLVHRLNCLRTKPSIFESTSGVFNASSKKIPMHKSFIQASLIEEILQLKIVALRDELHSLSPYAVDALEFRMAA